jgi:hypothetical protein
MWPQAASSDSVTLSISAANESASVLITSPARVPTDPMTRPHEPEVPLLHIGRGVVVLGHNAPSPSDTHAQPRWHLRSKA